MRFGFRPTIRASDRTADQERLARQAIGKLSEWEAAPPEEREDTLAKTAMDALEKWSGT
jgi:hypothetical protein